ncbi:hypothetical protein D3C80_865330 [compost metagenome]
MPVLWRKFSMCIHASRAPPSLLSISRPHGKSRRPWSRPSPNGTPCRSFRPMCRAMLLRRLMSIRRSRRLSISLTRSRLPSRRRRLRRFPCARRRMVAARRWSSPACACRLPISAPAGMFLPLIREGWSRAPSRSRLRRVQSRRSSPLPHLPSFRRRKPRRLSRLPSPRPSRLPSRPLRLRLPNSRSREISRRWTS